MLLHTVQDGESVISIAAARGLSVDRIWALTENFPLKDAGRTPALLKPGDELTIPELTKANLSCSTEKRHRFRRLGVPTKLRLRFLREGSPRADAPYRLIVDGTHYPAGSLSTDGALEVAIPPAANLAQVTVGPDDDQEHFEMRIGGLDPVSEISGVQQRLNNLGFKCRNEDGTLDASTVNAIKVFQDRHGLETTGKPDEPTCAKLASIYERSGDATL